MYAGRVLNTPGRPCGIYISALNYGGKPQHFLDLARHRQIELALAEPIPAEVARILDKKFPA